MPSALVIFRRRGTRDFTGGNVAELMFRGNVGSARDASYSERVFHDERLIIVLAGEGGDGHDDDGGEDDGGCDEEYDAA